MALLVFFSTKEVLAAEDFYISSEVTYRIHEAGGASVKHAITITNATTEKYATDYTLLIRGSGVSDVKAYSEEEEFTTKLVASEESEVKVFFGTPVAGEGKERKFNVEYFSSAVSKQAGDITEISIPKLTGENFSSHVVKLEVPVALGAPAYISPEPNNKLETSGVLIYYFNDLPSEVNITAAFGEFQVFSFDLTYHLQNPLAWPTEMIIAIPPDTSFQKVYYETISPKPDSIYKDADGNWLANYSLSARERLDVRAMGTAQIFSIPWKIFFSDDVAHARNLAASKFWQVNDPAVIELAKRFLSPKEIYDYVVSTLSYSYEKVSIGGERLGAVDALKNPAQAICTEFTDVFITLARAAGIPAREVNGYAYTDNTKLRPLSLVADVLHAWPEYWDSQKSLWVPVDPTWGDTTGGVDYFTKLDMRHLTFVVHGEDPQNPIPPGSYKLGANPQKDIFVALGNLPEQKNTPKITISQHTSLPFQGVRLIAKIENSGLTALYDQKVELSYDEQVKLETEIPLLLPYEIRTMEFTLPYGFFGDSTPNKAVLLVGGTGSSFSPDKNPATARDVVAIVVFIVVGFSIIIISRKKKNARK